MEFIFTHLEKYLQEDPNYELLATRKSPTTPNEYIPKAEARIPTIPQLNPEILISIHLNSAGPDASGLELYGTPPAASGYPQPHHADSLRLADLLHKHAQNFGYSKSEVRYMYFVGPNNDRRPVEKSNTEYINQYGSNGSFGMVEHVGCPAVLTENGYVSSTVDMELMKDSLAHQRAAAYHYRAICEYFGTTPLRDELGRSV